ncbi:MAG: PadR family transcriptional regulator [bacterium]|nr:PadR family transcriptional regulator [bacterium]
MKPLTRKEELLLLTILKLNEEAYLVSIQDCLAKITGRKLGMSTIHLPLSKLENRGLIESGFGEATAVRGGRRKRIYRVTEKGLKALHDYREISNSLWMDYLKLAKTPK